MGGRVRQLSGNGAGALGIDKGKQLHVFDPLDQIKRCLEILFRLAGEADNDITGEGYTGDFLLSIIDQVHILGNRIVAVHFFQDTVTTGLHRQMDMLAQVILRGNGIDQLTAGILGVAGHKADLVIARNGAQQVEQIGKIRLFFQTFAIAVYVLAQQGDFFIALFHQGFELCQNIRRGAAALAPAHIGHNAVGAEIIAPVHDGQPGAEAGITPDGQLLHHGVALDRGFQVALAAVQALHQHGGQAVNAVHAEHQIHIRIAGAQLIHNMLLLRHAAAYPDDQAGVLFLQLFQRADIAEHALFRMFAHSAGIEQDQICLLDGITDAEADVHQHAAYLLTIVHVLLAAIAAHIGKGRGIISLGDDGGGIRVMGIG